MNSCAMATVKDKRVSTEGKTSVTSQFGDLTIILVWTLWETETQLTLAKQSKAEGIEKVYIPPKCLTFLFICERKGKQEIIVYFSCVIAQYLVCMEFSGSVSVYWACQNIPHGRNPITLVDIPWFVTLHSHSVITWMFGILHNGKWTSKSIHMKGIPLSFIHKVEIYKWQTLCQTLFVRALISWLAWKLYYITGSFPEDCSVHDHPCVAGAKCLFYMCVLTSRRCWFFSFLGCRNPEKHCQDVTEVFAHNFYNRLKKKIELA